MPSKDISRLSDTTKKSSISKSMQRIASYSLKKKVKLFFTILLWLTALASTVLILIFKELTIGFAGLGISLFILGIMYDIVAGGGADSLPLD